MLQIALWSSFFLKFSHALDCIFLSAMPPFCSCFQHCRRICLNLFLAICICIWDRFSDLIPRLTWMQSKHVPFYCCLISIHGIRGDINNYVITANITVVLLYPHFKHPAPREGKPSKTNELWGCTHLCEENNKHRYSPLFKITNLLSERSHSLKWDEK